ncbi:NUDIX hydrolase [Penicillium alfredii]|uniref:NUDIX hydrolase n=1 Tax=Penicillium alfredii TaxID=1506179 RepID=A0A9W9FRX7_9EURO|nr:NUDIX hydrolase [Penicillium alfredii]KAJ5105237.1 NUDIX hydrolase [Penicillium alfredii]
MEARVGIGVFVCNEEGEFVLGKRQGSMGAGTWAIPGGHLEFGESFENCAVREVLEETGLEIRELRFLTATNSVMEKEDKHYVTIFMRAVVSEAGAQPQIVEPEKCSAWEWVSWDEFQDYVAKQMNSPESEFQGRKMFLPLVNLLQQRPDFRI